MQICVFFSELNCCAVDNLKIEHSNAGNWHVVALVVLWRLYWPCFLCAKALVSRLGEHVVYHLQTREHDCLRQDVRGEFAAQFHGVHVRLEPAFPHD